MKSPFKMDPDLREDLIAIVWGHRVQRYRTPVNCSIARLIKRTLLNRCSQCGRNKKAFAGNVFWPTDVCPVHDLNPGEREQDHPVNPAN